MIKLGTKSQKPIYDIRKNLIGDFTIYLNINELKINDVSVTATGIYFYVNANLEEINLTPARTELLWETVNQIEVNALQFLNVGTLKEAVLQRVVEFTFLQLEQENGQNWGTIVGDWELIPEIVNTI